MWRCQWMYEWNEILSSYKILHNVKCFVPLKRQQLEARRWRWLGGSGPTSSPFPNCQLIAAAALTACVCAPSCCLKAAICTIFQCSKFKFSTPGHCWQPSLNFLLDIQITLLIYISLIFQIFHFGIVIWDKVIGQISDQDGLPRLQCATKHANLLQEWLRLLRRLWQWGPLLRLLQGGCQEETGAAHQHASLIQ